MANYSRFNAVTSEILKLYEHNGVQVLKDLFNAMYDTGGIPTDILKSLERKRLKKD